MVTLYSKPNCPQCTATKREFKINGILFTEIDLTKDEIALNKINSLGYKSVPVVETKTVTWVGYQPDMIARL